MVFEHFREFNALVEVPSAFDPVGSGQAHYYRKAVRPHFAHCIGYFHGEPDPVCETAAVFVCAVVDKRIQEL